MFKWFGKVNFSPYTKVTEFANHLKDRRLMGSKCKNCGSGLDLYYSEFDCSKFDCLKLAYWFLFTVSIVVWAIAPHKLEAIDWFSSVDIIHFFTGTDTSRAFWAKSVLTTDVRKTTMSAE